MEIQEIQKRIQRCQGVADQFEEKDNVMYHYYIGKKAAYDEVLTHHNDNLKNKANCDAPTPEPAQPTQLERFRNIWNHLKIRYHDVMDTSGWTYICVADPRDEVNITMTTRDEQKPVTHQNISYHRRRELFLFNPDGRLHI